MVPDLLPDVRDQRDGQPHPLGTTDPADPVDVVGLLVRQGDVDHVGEAFDVEAASSHVGANQEPDAFSLELFQVGLSLLGLPVAVEADAREPPVVVEAVEVALQVVAVLLGPAEDDAVVHLELGDGGHAVLRLHYLHRLGPGLWK